MLKIFSICSCLILAGFNLCKDLSDKILFIVKIFGCSILTNGSSLYHIWWSDVLLFPMLLTRKPCSIQHIPLSYEQAERQASAADRTHWVYCTWWRSPDAWWMDLGPIPSVMGSVTVDFHWWRCRWRLPLPLPLGLFIPLNDSGFWDWLSFERYIFLLGTYVLKKDCNEKRF